MKSSNRILYVVMFFLGIIFAGKIGMLCMVYEMQQDYRERSAALERREELISKGGSM